MSNLPLWNDEDDKVKGELSSSKNMHKKFIRKDQTVSEGIKTLIEKDYKDKDNFNKWSKQKA